MINKIDVVDAAELDPEFQQALNMPEADENLPLGMSGPVIIMRRHERSTTFGDSYGLPKATYIDGYDDMGCHVASKSLLERQTKFGRVWQMVVEKWQIDVVRSMVGGDIADSIHGF